jgi:hypothetical protein
MPIAKETGGNFTPAPQGTHVARCISCISLGTQPANNPQFTDTWKIMLGWEIPGETFQIQGTGERKPMTLNKEYSLSLGKKANLRRDLEGWRGRQFTAEELAGFEVSKVIGVPCLISVVHKTSGKGTTYAAIASISALPKGTICPPQVHPPTIYEIEQGKDKVFATLPEFVRKKIEQCEEWTNPAIDRETPGPDGQPAAPEDDVPF